MIGLMLGLIQMKYRYSRPNRDQLNGFSCSEFKTWLKRLGHEVPRNFFGVGGCMSKFNNRYYYFSWEFSEFKVYISKDIDEIDFFDHLLRNPIPFKQFYISSLLGDQS